MCVLFLTHCKCCFDRIQRTTLRKCLDYRYGNCKLLSMWSNKNVLCYDCFLNCSYDVTKISCQKYESVPYILNMPITNQQLRICF